MEEHRPRHVLNGLNAALSSTILMMCPDPTEIISLLVIVEVFFEGLGLEDPVVTVEGLELDATGPRLQLHFSFGNNGVGSA